MNTQYTIYAEGGVYEKKDKNKYYFVEQTTEREGYITSEVTPEEVEKIKFSTDALLSYMYFKRKKIEISLNYDDFQNVIKTHTAELSTYQPLVKGITYESDMLFVNINRTFTNYINSCRIFIDHIDGQLKHKYKEHSGEYKTFKQAKSYCYDNYFSYRFFYHLRNYVEHMNYPIHDVIVESEVNADKSSMDSSVGLYFNRDELLKCKNFFTKIVDELKIKDERIPVLELVGEFQGALEIILDSLFIAERKYYTENMNVIIDFYNRRKRANDVQIVNFYEDEHHEIQINFLGLRLDIIHSLVEDLNNIYSRYKITD